MNATAPIHEPRELPHSEEAEQAILGAVLLNNDALERCGALSAEHFYMPVHGRLLDAIRTIVDRGQVANPVTLKAMFEKDADLAGVGGAAYVVSMVKAACLPNEVQTYAAHVRDLWTRRQLVAIADDVKAEAYHHEADETATDQVERAERALYELAEQGRGPGTGPRALRDFTVTALELAEKAYKRPSGVSGIATGLTKLDAMLGGLQNSDLIVIAGRPAMGKSGLAVNIGFRASQRADEEDGGACLISSLEMGGEQLAQRLLAELSGIPADFIRKGDLRNFEALIRASQAISSVPLIIDDTPALSIAQLRARARRVKRQHGIKLIVVDYLQLLRPSFRVTAESRVQEVTEISQGLKALAKELDVPVVALSQLSRKVEERHDKRPLLSDLRESGSIEQDADVVIFIYRDEYYAEREECDPSQGERYTAWRNRMDAARGKAELIVAKHRHGPTGTVNVAFHGPTTKFSDLEE